MNLKEYFGSRHGVGVLSTADADGRVDAAIYSRPHVFDDGTLAFVMRERLTHHNLGQNARAAYLFLEDGSRLGGLRLFLRRIREETDHELIAGMTRRHLTPEADREKGPKFLVTFAVEKILPLVGGGEPGVTAG
jgi:hypothetical protein